MSADESFSSSDESLLIQQQTTDGSCITCNHRLVNSNELDHDYDNEDLFPLINEGDTLKLFKKPKKIEKENEFWLVCKAYFSIIFLMVALLSLFFLFFNHLVLNTNSFGNILLSTRDLNNSTGVPEWTLPTFQINLDSEDRYHLFWSIDYQSQIVLFELKLKFETNFDWFAFGFSDYGSLSNADLCLIWFDKRRRLHLEDVKTNNETLVVLDPPNSNDCQFIKSKRNRSQRLFYLAFRRYFDTCDPNDYLIDNGTTHLVYATGRGPLYHVEGLQLSNYLHGFQRTQLLKPLIKPKTVNNEESIKTFEFLVNNVTVPNVETTYWCTLVKLPDEFKHPVHIVQYEAVVEDKSRDLVHHIELFHCEVDAELDLPQWNGLCHDSSMPELLQNCKRVVAAWAYGSGPITYPDRVGLPMGGNNYSLYLMIEIHYNNPELKSEAVDCSGIRIHYTEKLRPIESGILEVGLEYTDKNSIPPNTVMEVRGYCVSECTRVGLPPNGITIFASQLHTHLTGVSTWTEHVRGGVQLPDLNRDNHYSPHFQEIRKLPEPGVHVYPGDALVHVCRYDTRKRTQVTLGGFGIADEMCVNYFHYYPKSDLEVCKSSIDTEHLQDYFESMRLFENQNTSSRYPVADNYRNIHWTPYRIKRLDQLYQSAPLSVQCNQSTGFRFPGYWNGIPLTTVIRKRNNFSNNYNNTNRCRWVLKKFLSERDDEVDGDDMIEELDYLDQIRSRRQQRRNTMKRRQPKSIIKQDMVANQEDADLYWQLQQPHSTDSWIAAANHKPSKTIGSSFSQNGSPSHPVHHVSNHTFENYHQKTFEKLFWETDESEDDLNEFVDVI